jgi:hypothetical protein
MMTAEQVVANLQEVQRQVQELQQAAMTNVQTMATMQGVIVAIQANQAEGPRDRGDRNIETKMNHHAAKGLQPTAWAGDNDPMSFQEFSAEFVNFANALNPGSKHILDQATKHKGVIDITIDLMDAPLVEGLAEALDGEIYRQLYKSTKLEARRVVHNAGSGNGLQAWLNLNNAYAPRSATDAAVAMKRVMYPVRVKTEDKMPIELQKWLADLLEFEQRFHAMDDTSKRCGLQMLLPETMWQNRMAGQQYETFSDLLKHVKDLVGDRTLAAMKTRPTSQHQGPQPMDIGQFDNESDLNAFGGNSKGKGKSNGWGQPTWDQPQKGDKGKSKGKGKTKGDKGKGKGKDASQVQCWTCSGWGHRSNQCPNSQHNGGKGVNEVGDGPSETPQEPSIPDDGNEEEEEPAWLGMVEDAPQDFVEIQNKKKKKVVWKPMVVNYNRNPNPPTTTATTARVTTTNGTTTIGRVRSGPPGATHYPGTTPTRAQKINKSIDQTLTTTMCPRSWLPKVMTKLTITKKGYENYNQFSLLEDADGSDGSSEDGQEEIMFVSESTSTSISAGRWTKISAIVDSGAVEHVLPERWLPSIQMEASPGSKAGKKYLSATGQEIPNLGQKALTGKTREGQTRGIIFQVAPVRKPLMSVAKMNEAGNDVNLRGDRPHIMNVKTKAITALRREGKTFILDLWIKIPEADPVPQKSFGFSRRG